VVDGQASIDNLMNHPMWNRMLIKISYPHEILKDNIHINSTHTLTYTHIHTHARAQAHTHTPKHTDEDRSCHHPQEVSEGGDPEGNAVHTHTHNTHTHTQHTHNTHTHTHNTHTHTHAHTHTHTQTRLPMNTDPATILRK
jgi:hypothetical protein